MESAITEIYDLLYRPGLTTDHICFFHAAYAVWLCTEQRERLLLAAKQLYTKVPKQYRTTWNAVEQNIRRAILGVWESHCGQLEEVAGMALETKPRPAQFLGILTANIQMVSSINSKPNSNAANLDSSK